MNLFEEAVIYATVMHAGKTRKVSHIPYIVHPMEVAQIISTMTSDIEVITAGILHDVVEDTDGTLGEIRSRFGARVAELVASETENKYKSESSEESWKKRKTETLAILANTKDIGIKMLWLADKLSNIRSLAGLFSERGEAMWQDFHQKDPQMHRWYYKSIAEYLEIDLNRTGAFKEMIKHINSIWPETFVSDKAKYRKFKEISIEGCKEIGKGAKGSVYKYNDELIVKVYNDKNMFKDIERENYLARKAFVSGIPTAISFGLVKVGKRYGSMFELLDSDTVSNLIARNPSNVEFYANKMAELAKTIHTTSTDDPEIPSFMHEVYAWVNSGIAYEDEALTEKITQLIDALPRVSTMIHGDFHTGNVIVQNDEYLLIDMDRLSTCHPIVELCGLYMFYYAFGDMDPTFVEDFMGFSYATANKLWDIFIRKYLDTEDERIIQDVTNKASLLTYVRLVRRCYKKGAKLSEKDAAARDYYMQRIRELLPLVDTLDF